MMPPQLRPVGNWSLRMPRIRQFLPEASRFGAAIAWSSAAIRNRGESCLLAGVGSAGAFWGGGTQRTRPIVGSRGAPSGRGCRIEVPEDAILPLIQRGVHSLPINLRNDGIPLAMVDSIMRASCSAFCRVLA